MINGKSTLECRHCGGAMIDRFEEITCVMCGRPASHSCDNCIKAVVEEKSFAVAPKGRKKATAA